MVENPPFVKQILNRHGKVSSAELSQNLSNPGQFLQLSGTAQPWRNAGTKGTAGTLHGALICGLSEYPHPKHQRKKSSVCLCQKPAQHSHAELAFYFYPAIQVLPSRIPTIARQRFKFSLTHLSFTTQCSIPLISPYRITTLLWARKSPSLLKHPHLNVTL